MFNLYIALFLVAWQGMGYSAELAKISQDKKALLSTQDAVTSFKVGDYLCVVDNGKEISCGSVQMATALGAIIRVQFVDETETLVPGQKLQLAKEHQAPRINPETDEALEESNWEIPLDQVKTVTGEVNPQSTQAAAKFPPQTPNYMLSFAVNNLNPHFHAQMATKLNYSIGIELGACFFSGYTTPFLNDRFLGTLFGGLLTFGYHSVDYFKGTWVKGGIGYYKGSLSQGNFIGTVEAPAAILVVGKRWLSEKSSWGIAGGIQFFGVPYSGILASDVMLFTPTITLEIGIPVI